MSFHHDFLFNRHSPIDPIAILPILTRRLLHIVAQIFYPMLFYVQTIAQSLLLSFLRVCHRNCLPAILTIGQYFADEFYKNLILIINRTLPARHAYSGGKKASQGRSVVYRTKGNLSRNPPPTLLP
jgi:hypothetical protein